MQLSLSEITNALAKKDNDSTLKIGILLREHLLKIRCAAERAELELRLKQLDCLPTHHSEHSSRDLNALLKNKLHNRLKELAKAHFGKISFSVTEYKKLRRLPDSPVKPGVGAVQSIAIDELGYGELKDLLLAVQVDIPAVEPEVQISLPAILEKELLEKKVQVAFSDILNLAYVINFLEPYEGINLKDKQLSIPEGTAYFLKQYLFALIACYQSQNPQADPEQTFDLINQIDTLKNAAMLLAELNSLLQKTSQKMQAIDKKSERYCCLNKFHQELLHQKQQVDTLNQSSIKTLTAEEKIANIAKNVIHAANIVSNALQNEDTAWSSLKRTIFDAITAISRRFFPIAAASRKGVRETIKQSLPQLQQVSVFKASHTPSAQTATRTGSPMAHTRGASIESAPVSPQKSTSSPERRNTMNH